MLEDPGTVTRESILLEQRGSRARLVLLCVCPSLALRQNAGGMLARCKRTRLLYMCLVDPSYSPTAVRNPQVQQYKVRLRDMVA